MTKIKPRITALLLTIALLTVSLHAAAAGWRQGGINGATKVFPARQVTSYSLIIESSGDEADIYYPKPSKPQLWHHFNAFPIVIMNQGAKVDKEYYSQLAVGVARHGFIVVVPNQRNSLFNDSLRYAEVATITEVLEQMRMEDNSPESPIYGIADPNRLALMGHSFGGASMMFAVGQLCSFPFCNEDVGFERPPELMAAVLTSSNARSFDFDTTGIAMGMVVGGEEIARDNQLNTYTTLEKPKAFITIAGANHYGLCDADVPPGASPIDGETEQTVPNGITAARYSYWAGTFLRAHVHNDPRARREIYQPTTQEGVTIVSDEY